MTTFYAVSRLSYSYEIILLFVKISNKNTPKYLLYFLCTAETYTEPSQTSKIERFAKKG